MLFDNVAAFVQDFKSSLFFYSRVVPGVCPYNFNSCIRVYGLNAARKTVYSADTFRDRECCNIADFVCLCFKTGCNTGKIACFIHFSEVGRNVFCALVAGTVTEFYVREILCNFDSPVHKAKACCVDYVASLVNKVTDNFFTVRILRDIFYVHRLYSLLFKGKTSLILCRRVAFVVDRADVDKTYFQVFLCDFCISGIFL